MVETSGPPSHDLEINPPTALEFVLVRDAASSDSSSMRNTPKCNITLRHTKNTNKWFSFKVRNDELTNLASTVVISGFHTLLYKWDFLNII